jgi:prophage DNA circulation protein
MTTPTWIDQLQPASFKGVRFHVDSVEWTAGDNVVVREYPFQDRPTVFRMGKAAQTLKFSAYVIGDDYIAQRDELAQALTGDGDLVHPTAGTMRAFVAEKFRVSEAPTSEGGIARFDLSFVLAEPRRYPVAVANTGGEAVVAAQQAKEAAVDEFASKFSLANAPGWVAENVVDRINTTMASVMGPIQEAASQINEFSNQVVSSYQALQSSVNSLVAAPKALAGAIAGLFSLPGDLSAATARLFSGAFEGVFDMPSIFGQSKVKLPVGAGAVMSGYGSAADLSVDTAAQALVAQNNAALDSLIQSLALASLVEAQAALGDAAPDAVDTTETSRLRALLYSRTTGMLMAASSKPGASGATSTAWHDAMLAMLTASLAEMRSRAGGGSRIDTYTPNGWEPVWQISYRLYGTADFAEEILAMNPHITNPLLVPPGRALTVVRHG